MKNLIFVGVVVLCALLQSCQGCSSSNQSKQISARASKYVIAKRKAYLQYRDSIAQYKVDSVAMILADKRYAIPNK
jgi:hypothetical protein